MIELTSLLDAKTKIKLVFESVGIKTVVQVEGDHYLLPKADLYLDCRGLADGSHGGPGGSGDQESVQKWTLSQGESVIADFDDLIKSNLQRLTSRRGAGKEYDKPFKILTMCAHGMHRSRAAKHILANKFAAEGWKVEVVK